MKPRRENETTKRGRGRPMGSVVIILIFLLFVVFSLFQKYAASADDEKLTVGQFAEKLITGQVQEFTFDPDGEIKGVLRPDAKSAGARSSSQPSGGSHGSSTSGSGGILGFGERSTKKCFHLYYPEARDRLMDLQRMVRPLDKTSPWSPASLRAALDRKEAVVLEATVLDKSDDTGHSTRLFAELVDSEGHKYVEVGPDGALESDPSKGGAGGEFAAVVQALRDRNVKIETYAVAGGVTAVAPNSLLPTLLTLFGPWILILILFWFFFFRQIRASGSGGGILGFGRSRAVLYTKENRTNVTFDDVAGIDEAKDEVKEIIEFLKNPQRFARLGGRIPRGVLLVGPPGTGKTLLAKAIAGEAEVPFFSISGSDFVEMFVGVGASRVRDLFKQAKENAPCIIFLDEIDAVGRKRGSGFTGGHDEREQTLNAILVEMDGFDTNEGIIVIASTNRPDVLDPALLRPGRFDREVVIDLPDVKGREEILKVHARRVKLGAETDLTVLARATPMFSGADLAALVNEAAITAVLKKRDAVLQEDLEEARDKVRFGRQKRSRIVADEDRLTIARHEAGHAVVAALIQGSEPVHKITIIPRGMALGATMYLPEKDRLDFSKKRAEATLSVAYGGRVAEEILGDDISAGAANDIARATELARMMVCEWGFSSKVGPLRYVERTGSEFLGTEIGSGRLHSEDTAREIDEEVKKICDAAYRRTREVLDQHKDDLERVARALLQYETITGAELKGILEGKSIETLRVAATPPPPAASPAAKPRVEPRPSLGPGTLPEAGLAPA